MFSFHDLISLKALRFGALNLFKTLSSLILIMTESAIAATGFNHGYEKPNNHNHL